MIETKFTKGDWKSITINHPEIPLTINAVCVEQTEVIKNVEIKSVKTIAQIDFQKNNNPIDSELEANSNLICAAPDMFNALRDLYEDKEVWSDLFESQQEFICRVLNKATGSSFFQH